MNNKHIEIEKLILGECINSKENYIKLVERGITKESFVLNNHQYIFDAMKEGIKKYNTLNTIVLSNELNDKVNTKYLYELGSNINTNNLQDIESYAKILSDNNKSRKYIKLKNDIDLNNLDELGSNIIKRVEEIESIENFNNYKSRITTLNNVKLVNLKNSEKINTGFNDLDYHMLGFMLGSLSVITGYNGNGKSTLINQMCIAASIQQGYKVFCYSPELTNADFKNWLYTTIAEEKHLTSVDDSMCRFVNDKGISLIDNWIEDKLYVYNDEAPVFSESMLINDMEYLATKEGVKVFVIDNLMKVELINADKNEYLAQKKFVNKLKEFARKHKAIVHLVAHPKKPQKGDMKITKFDIAGSGDITNLADYVFVMERYTNKERENNENLKGSSLRLIKDRHSGIKELNLSLDFDRGRKRYYSNSDELNKSYGYTYEIIQYAF